MNYLSAEAIGRNLGERWLFQNLTFGILQGEKVALIGSNGTGKSSMLDILAGKIPPDGGVVSLRKDIRVGYLEQNPVFQESKTILETIFYAENSITRAIKNYEKAIETNNQDLLAECIEILDSQNGWDYEAKVKQILGKLGILDTDKLISELSGGQKKRVALARVLIENPDFLILDEPTNHLDLESIEWLEGHLSSSNTTLLLVTHDRYFLDKVCNRILELANNQIYKYTGSYAYFLEKKAERQEMEAATQEKLKNQLSKELEWMRRQPKARTTKAQYRIDAFHDLKEKATGFKKEDKLELNMRSERMGKKIIEIQHVSKAFNGQDFIKEFSYTFKRGDRIGIVGKNGMGKSTLLQMITDQLKPDSGKVVKGETIKIGLTISALAALMYGVFYLIFDFIFPEFKDELLNKIQEVTIKQNPTLTSEQLQMSMKFVKTFMNPYIVVPFTIVMYCVIGLIHSLIVGAIVKKDKPVF